MNLSHGESNSTTMGQLRARRKASKMLVAVVIMFAACYFPVHALGIIRYSYLNIDQNEVISVLSLLSHWLCYANSAINPLIYNFMSGKSIDYMFVLCKSKAIIVWFQKYQVYFTHFTEQICFV